MEVRKVAPAYAVSAWRRFRHAGGLGSLLLAALFYVAALLLDAWPINPLPYRQGQYVPADIYSRATFQVLVPNRLEEHVSQKKFRTPATFQLNTPLVEKILVELKALPERLKAASQPAEIDETLRKEFGLSKAEELKAWQQYGEGDRREQYAEQLDKLRQELASAVIVRREDAQAQRRERTAWQVILTGGPKPAAVDIVNLVDQKDAPKVRLEAERLAGLFDRDIRENVRNFLLQLLLTDEPLYRYDAAATQKDIEKAVAAARANPPEQVYDVYETGKLLVKSSASLAAEQKPPGLSAEDLEKLRVEQESFLAEQYGKTPWLLWSQLAGRATILLLVVALLCVYVAHYQQPLMARHWKAFAVVMVLLLMLALNKVMLQLADLNGQTAILPVLMAAVIFTIAYDQRFALLLGLVLSLLLVLQARAGLPLLGVALAGLAASVFQLRELRTRSKLVVTAAFTSLVVLVVILSQAMIRAMPWRFALLDGLWGVGFAMLAGIALQAALPLIERIFRIATSMTLLEWCDASKPLLKQLAMEAPGTYNHSLLLGTMCEAAAEAIGARGLLARVGAYYHDIGKINKPEYFAENQAGGPSRHAKLSPAMSLLVIIGHVKDGLELARRYGLPQVLWEFIAAHHGTTLVQYFYKAATDQRKADVTRAPDEVEFRYPGPKPLSREAAILMLADAAESSVRSMSEPTPGRIENQVHTMVTRRLMDGQLDECDLKLNEVHKIEDSLVKSLCGIYHSRIAYPTPAGERPSAAEMPTPR